MTSPTPTHLSVPSSGPISTKNSNESLRNRIQSKIRSLSPGPSISARESSPPDREGITSVVRRLSMAPIGSAYPGVIMSLANVPPVQIAPKHTIRTDIFPTNDVSRIEEDISLPKVGDLMTDTLQLVLCVRLLSNDKRGPTLPISSITVASGSFLNGTQQEWVQSMNDVPLEREYLDQLLNRIVTQFISETIKDAEFIYEVVLIGPVLAIAPFRRLIRCFVDEFDKNGFLHVEMLQGLAQLVQDAPVDHLKADDMIQVLYTITRRLDDPGQQSKEYSGYLILAAAKVLNAMADNKVKGLDRTLHHEPLIKVLKKLSNNKDPFLKYRALYALLALELVRNNESAWACAIRLALDIVGGGLKMSGVANKDYSGIPEGLTSLWSGTREIAESARNAYQSEDKRQCYLAIRGIEVYLLDAHLADLNEYICKETCSNDPLFQWGVCEVLGRMAVDNAWDDITRGHALTFLGEIFKENTAEKQQPDVRCLVLTILKQIADSSTGTESVKDEARRLFLELRSDDIEMSQHPYTFLDRLPHPRASPLLKKVNDNPDLELILERLRRQRLNECSGGAIYVEALSKANLQASGEDLVLLKTRADAFLGSEREVMLILGDSGAGKSTFNRRLEYERWGQYKTGSSVPVFIDLKSVPEPDNDMIQQQLSNYGVSQVHIDELRKSRKIILICDGYDECRKWSNLHTNNWLNKSNHWSAKMVITCRSQYLNPNYRQYFEPQATDDYSHHFGNKLDLFEEAVIVPFNMGQVESYVDQYIALPETLRIFGERPAWSATVYLDKLRNVPQLMDLIKNPFLLRLMLNILPTITDGSSLAKMTRVQLYDKYVMQHFEHEQKRLGGQNSSNKMNQEDRKAFEGVSHDFIHIGINFAARLSDLIFKEQEGVNAVKYSITEDKNSWKTQFFGLDTEAKLLREASPLVRSGIRYEFTHRSIMEYFFTCMIFEPRKDSIGESDSSENCRLQLSACLESSAEPRSLQDHLFNQRDIVSEPSVVHFLAERVQQSSKFKNQLQTIIALSKSNSAVSQAASNAITILVKSGEQFNGSDLRGIRIPGANLSGGHFDSTQFQEADLTGVNLTETWLRQADFSHTFLKGVKFSEKPFLHFSGSSTIAISPNRKLLGVGFMNGRIKVIEAQTWITSHVFKDASGTVTSLTFSAGAEIAAGSSDGSVRIWNIQDGMVVRVLTGHSAPVTQVAYSRDGCLLGSCSLDMTVKIWDASSGTCLHNLDGHSIPAMKLAWSPDGQQLASSDLFQKVRLWSATTGNLEREIPMPIQCLAYAPNGCRLTVGTRIDVVQFDLQTNSRPSRAIGRHTGPVIDIAYSPEGHWIASAGVDGTVRIWDGYTGASKYTLNGHEGPVPGVLFLNEQEVLAIGNDTTVRFWVLGNTAVENGMTEGVVLSAAHAHRGPIGGVGYLSGGHLVSISADNTLREWDAETGSSTIGFESRHPFESFAVSPEGDQIAIDDREGIKIYKRADGPTFSVPGEIFVAHRCAEYSPCGRWLALGDNAGRVRLLDRINGADERTLTTLQGIVTSLNFSRDGNLLFSRGKGQQGQLLNQLSNTQPGLSPRFQKKNVGAVQFSPCEKMMAWNPVLEPGKDAGWRNELKGAIHILELLSGDDVAVLKGHKDAVTSIAWNLDWIASGSIDHTVRVWKKEAVESNSGWACVAILKDFVGGVLSVDWSPISPLELATGSLDNSLCVWKIIEDDMGKVRVDLKWRSTDRFRLTSTGAKIVDAIDFDRDHMKLLHQHGAGDKSAVVNFRLELIALIQEYELMQDTVRKWEQGLGDVNTSVVSGLDEELGKLAQHELVIRVDESALSSLEAELKRLVHDQTVLGLSIRRMSRQIQEANDNQTMNMSRALSTLLQQLEETDESFADAFKETIKSAARKLVAMEQDIRALLQHLHAVDNLKQLSSTGTNGGFTEKVGRIARSFLPW